MLNLAFLMNQANEYMPKKERKNETHQKVLQFEERLQVKVPTADDDVKHIFG